MEDSNSQAKTLENERINRMITEMTKSGEQLQIGHKLIYQFENLRGFYTGLLKIALNQNSSDSEVKLSGSLLVNYLRRNWDNEAFVSVEEKMVRLFHIGNSCFVNS